MFSENLLIFCRFAIFSLPSTIILAWYLFTGLASCFLPIFQWDIPRRVDVFLKFMPDLDILSQFKQIFEFMRLYIHACLKQ